MVPFFINAYGKVMSPSLPMGNLALTLGVKRLRLLLTISLGRVKSPVQEGNVFYHKDESRGWLASGRTVARGIGDDLPLVFS